MRLESRLGSIQLNGPGRLLTMINRAEDGRLHCKKPLRPRELLNVRCLWMSCIPNQA